MQSLEWIESLPVASLADRNGAHLFLWVPALFNREGIGARIARAWGFKVVSEIVWHKMNFGLGKFPRPMHEISLVCRLGTLPFGGPANVGSVQRWSQTRAGGNGGKVHSSKPEGFYDLIELVSPAPRVELFARRQRLGWHTWGDEAMNHVSLISAP